jgi:Spy/CpxP family protein refolding chaperone
MVELTAGRPARGAFAVIAIFALGIVFGIAISFVVVHHVGRLSPRSLSHGGPIPIERLTRRLNLDAAQQEKVRAILERGHAQVREVLDDARRDIRLELRADQLETFDRLHARGRDRRN